MMPEDSSCGFQLLKVIIEYSRFLCTLKERRKPFSILLSTVAAGPCLPSPRLLGDAECNTPADSERYEDWGAMFLLLPAEHSPRQLDEMPVRSGHVEA